MTDYTMHEEMIEAHGLTFKVAIEPDYDSGTPWTECDGFGIVREGERNWYTGHIKKSPGERILHKGDRNCYSWVYDWAGTMKRALKDGWGPQDPALTKRQNAERAVQSDFDFLKAWCDDDWVWCGVCVTLMVPDKDGELVEYDGPLSFGFHDSLWSIEYWQYEPLNSKKNEYIWKDVIADMTADIAKKYLREQAEKQACAERDIVTV